MNPQGYNPPAGLPPISREANVYIFQAPVEATKNNEEYGTGRR